MCLVSALSGKTTEGRTAASPSRDRSRRYELVECVGPTLTKQRNSGIRSVGNRNSANSNAQQRVSGILHLYHHHLAIPSRESSARVALFLHAGPCIPFSLILRLSSSSFYSPDSLPVCPSLRVRVERSRFALALSSFPSTSPPSPPPLQRTQQTCLFLRLAMGCRDLPWWLRKLQATGF